VFVFEGHLVQREEVDRRFADYSEEAISDGIHYRDVTVKVACVRPRADGDPSGTGSSVWLEGEVIESPAFFRHPDHPETQLARRRVSSLSRKSGAGAANGASRCRSHARRGHACEPRSRPTHRIALRRRRQTLPTRR
jgi:hypothetical protein